MGGAGCARKKPEGTCGDEHVSEADSCPVAAHGWKQESVRQEFQPRVLDPEQDRLVIDPGSNGRRLRRSDLERYEARVVEPLTVKYRGLDLVFSPGATGGPTAVEMLNVLAQFPAAKVGYDTPGGLHLRAEATSLRWPPQKPALARRAPLCKGPKPGAMLSSGF